MRVLGMGVPEMVIVLLVLLVPIALVVALVVVLAKRSNDRQPLPDERQRASVFAYQRLSQLDDLRKRGAITDEEYASKKQEFMQDL
ncbi:c-type cytochrome biogenesis protein CcmI [Eggerthella guodeyinii]|uniref:C-type cytochrome biogenesis protein CcmI n=1 Tax=Eggerthella guodeyinii TaxID=2690837 RepID=A0A6L7ITB5_9ACTN|nr:c-type cytochrome biogenesis protein CcmI [Eggerthella guodeyinii]QOS68572.1 c-type cytochrome biogenesis protein CcmI [Eggerthella guodeyinii]